MSDASNAGSNGRSLGALLAALAPLMSALPFVPAFPTAAYGSHALHAALALSTAEPPGHPLAVLAARAATLVPLGPLALRFALCAAALTALAAAALYLAIDTALRATTALRPAVASPLALGATLIAFGTGPLLAAGTAPHVHAAALALACLALERWAAFTCAWPRIDLAALRAAALWHGLLLAEQPALAAALLPFALPGLARALRAYRLPAWNLAPLAISAPLWLYAALARAPELGVDFARTPLAIVRAAFTLADARTQAPNGGAAAGLAGPVAIGLFALAAIGAALGARASAQRRLALGLFGSLACAAAVGVLLEQGAALRALAVCAAAALAVFALAPLLASEAPGRLAVATAGLLVVLGASHLYVASRAAGALDGAASDALSGALRRALPPRSVLLLAPALGHGLLDSEAEERARPDLLAALAPFWLDLRAAERVAARHPELMPLLRAQLIGAQARGSRGNATFERDLPELPRLELTALAARRPTLLALSPERATALHELLLPHGLYHQVSTHAVGDADVELAAREHARSLARLYAELEVARLDAATRALLAKRHAAELAYALAREDARLEAHARERLAALQAH